MNAQKGWSLALAAVAIVVIALRPELDKLIGKVFHFSDGKQSAAAYDELLKKVRASCGGVSN